MTHPGPMYIRIYDNIFFKSLAIPLLAGDKFRVL